MRHVWKMVLVATAMADPGVAYGATSVRYALVIGNNYGKTPPGIELPALKHAEAEASALREKLVELGSFDASPERTVLLLGKTRDEILSAAEALAAQHRRDRKAIGDVPTLFAFFFTGHGLSGQLLTAEEPLTGRDLAAVFNDVAATFTVGVFDACFSGSLDLDALASKGLKLTPGFNAFEALPQEVIDAQGTMWFVSSQPDQVSYEDDDVGGVFTHYFLEAMEQAPHDNFGVTLEEIWEYARSHTQRHTQRALRPQTPQKLIRNLTSTGPLYFSFPTPRSATLAFEPEVAGRFLVRYENGQLTETITKEAGLAMQVTAYPTDIILERPGGKRDDRQYLSLAAGETVWVRASAGYRALSAIGSREETLTPKGGRLKGLVLTREVSHLAPIVDVGYATALPSRYGGQSMHSLTTGARLDYGWTSLRLGYTYGRHLESFDAWRYDATRHGVELSVGGGVELDDLRLVGLLLGRLAFESVAYGDGTHRDRRVPGIGLAVNGLWRFLHGPLSLYAFGRVAAIYEYAAAVAPIDGDSRWWLTPELTFGIAALVAPSE